MADQKQFLNVISREEAKTRFESALSLLPMSSELVTLDKALGRVLADDVTADVNVPSFDRSNFDGFAVKANNIIGASELRPITLTISSESVSTGSAPQSELQNGEAMSIATGGMLPAGADCVVLIEETERSSDEPNTVRISNPRHAGFGVTFTGTDIARGQVILYSGQVLTSRETGVLAAIGHTEIEVVRRPKIAVVSTGNEIIPPSATMQPGLVFDSNARIIADAIRECGGVPLEMGIAIDNQQELDAIVTEALNSADMVLLSGGTSKGKGDLSYRVLESYNNPGIVAHGVALKPGKPICLGVEEGKPLVILPGFPTSAIFTFHEFIAPIIRIFAGLRESTRPTVMAKLGTKLNSAIGRTEYCLVGLIHKGLESGNKEIVAYPLGKGSGSVTTFSLADGFFKADEQTELVETGETVSVNLLNASIVVADLTVIGSHCPRLDKILSEMTRQGFQVKLFSVGSTAGLRAAKRNDCDIAGIHLYNPKTDSYNTPFIDSDQINLVKGYTRQQGIVFRSGDKRFESLLEKSDIENSLRTILNTDQSIRMINRNAQSGTRIHIDRLLGDLRPEGYNVQPANHHAVVAAIEQDRADWGVVIKEAIVGDSLAFIPFTNEEFDFAIPIDRMEKESVKAFCKLITGS